MAKSGSKIFWHSSIFLGTVFSIWATAAFLSGLAEANWQFSELLKQYMVAVGLMNEYHTFSDFYTYIKGIEYLIAVAFLGTFPAFYSYLDKSSQKS